MVSDINTLRSHPDKFLLTHIEGVKENTKKLTNSKIAELVALFHDLGKTNPNFQDKLESNSTVNGYANHSYLSAYTFFCAFGCSRQNLEALKQFLKVDEFNQNDLIALTVLIAKHHGNLPDFSPTDHNGTGASILSKDENSAMFNFLSQVKDLPVNEFVNHFISTDDFRHFMTIPKVQQGYSEQLVFKGGNNKSALGFFLDNQFAFASVIQADKADAGKIGNIIDDQQTAVQTFSESFSFQLDSYLSKLNQNSELNKLRTTIRNHAVENVLKGLITDEHVYELTAPTGSGKTLMMLSLASEIIKEKGAKRIIYGLPFLSITEQVEAEILKIFEGKESFIQRIDSKSENHQFEKIQAELDSNPTEEKIIEANILEFQVNTFAYPFVITTFVRFFETLMSNHNAELLKLPNFSNCIFLLDEIQALPPRLYGFFVAYISKFCKKFNSYAIISTATQPNFELPVNNTEAKTFFSNYEKPISLLPLSYFENSLFNRYQIEFEKEPIDMETLKDLILSENQSTLVILNTIDDTKELFKKLQDELQSDLILLNTHFTPQHRKLKIYMAKRRLRQNKRIVVVSTQLIEAGVDIDFPVLYRDFATVASIVQSAGRCNRNGKLDSLGKVKLFKLQNKGKIRSDIIYQGKDKEILRFTKESFTKKQYQEKDLLAVQREFFNRIQSELNFALHSQNGINPDLYFIKDISECQFDRIGKFQLIDKQLFGEEFQYFVPKKHQDEKFENLLAMQNELIELLKNKPDQKLIRIKKKSIEIQLKKMAGQIVQVRLNKNQIKPLQGSNLHYFNLYKIDDKSYTFHYGIDINSHECII
jgi:CRISPR-associated endonuclease/helicase Cas3